MCENLYCIFHYLCILSSYLDFKVTYRNYTGDYVGRSYIVISLLQISFPTTDKTESLSKATVFTLGETMMKVYIHKDNAGDLVMEKTFPPQFTTRIKH